MSASLLRSALGVLAAVLLFASVSFAQIVETRQGEANPMVSVFRSTLYGGAAGGVLGLALGLAQDEEDVGDPVKWGFVGGTFFGFAYGLYHVQTRPEPHGLLDGRDGTWALAAPSVAPARCGARVTLAALHF